MEFDDEQTQQDLTLTLLSSPSLMNLAVVYYRERQQEEEVFFRTALSTGRNGKCGAVAATLAPEAQSNLPNVPGPISAWDFPVVIITQNDINMNPTLGTLFNVSKWGRRVAWVLHHETDEKWGTLIVTGKMMAHDEKLVFPGCVGWKVNLHLTVGRSDVLPRCAPLTVVQGAGTVTLTCATAGAEIWYTTDGTTPSSKLAGNASSYLYTGPVPVLSGDVVRAAAYASGYEKSPSKYIVVT